MAHIRHARLTPHNTGIVPEFLETTMVELIEFIYKWQTLIGSIFGGIFALCVALIVGHAVNRREDVSVGMLLIADLANIRIISEILKEKAQEENIPENQYSLWLAEKLTQNFPQLSPLFGASVVRMLPINTYLAAHLTLFQKIYINIGEMVERLTKDFTEISQYTRPCRPMDNLLTDSSLVSKYFFLAVQHASCAEYLIAELILSKVPTWNRFRQFIYTKKNEAECKKYLKNSR